MIAGDVNIFAVESQVTKAYNSLGLRALGYFVIWIGGLCYGVRDESATMLANSFDEVQRRIISRGLHTAAFVSEADAGHIADAFRDAVFADEPGQDFFGVPREIFERVFYENDLAWAPDGDEAFDDGSYVLQLDVNDKARLIAFRCGNNGMHDPATLREIWLSSETYYSVLEQWRQAFETEWKNFPKEDK
jgi:hypothetical protein